MPPEIPKDQPVQKFCNSTNLVFNDMFALILRSGGDVSMFVFTPDHMKQLARFINKKVAEYEELNGELEGRLPTEPMRSPIDMDKSIGGDMM